MDSLILFMLIFGILFFVSVAGILSTFQVCASLSIPVLLAGKSILLQLHFIVFRGTGADKSDSCTMGKANFVHKLS